MDSRMDAASGKQASRGTVINEKSPAVSKSDSSSSSSSSENSQPNPPESTSEGGSKRSFGLLGIGSKRQPSAPASASSQTTESSESPNTRREAAGNNSGLGLRAPSMHSPESASICSGLSVVESVSGDSKPPSHRSSGIGFVRRLRRLSTAAIGNKVNRLFSRSNNPSQDSLLISGPSSPTSVCMSPGAVPRSPSILTASESADAQQGRFSSSFGPGEGLATQPVAFRQADQASDWYAANAANLLPPLPPKPLSARRNRAMSEISPLMVRNRLPPEESTSPEGSGDSLSSKIAQTRAKAINSPLVASPLSRKSFNALSSASRAEDRAKAEDTRVQGMTKSVSDNLLTNSPLATPPAPTLLGRGALPKMPRAASSTATETYRPPAMPHRLSYQHAEVVHADPNSSAVRKAVDTPSPPENRSGRSHVSLAEDSRAPTMQRRRTALATLGWLSGSGNSGYSPQQQQQQQQQPQSHPQQQLSSTMLMSSKPPSSNRVDEQTLAQKRQPSNPAGADSPPSLLAAFQLRSRVSSSLFRKSSPGASARSSTSITSDSVQSWASAVAGGEMEQEDETSHDESASYSQRSMLSIAVRSHNKPSGGHSTLGHPDTSAYPPPNFDSSIMEWQQLSQEASSASYNHSQSSSTTNHMSESLLEHQFSASEGKHPGQYLAEIRAKPASSLVRVDTKSSNVSASATSFDSPSSTRRVSETAEGEPVSAGSNVSAGSGMFAYTTPQQVRSRGGSQVVHLARAATTNAIRLKEKSAAGSADNGSGNGNGSASGSGVIIRRASVNPVVEKHLGRHGSAPEPSNIDLAIERGHLRPRVRATSASNQPSVPGNAISSIGGAYDGFGYSTSTSASQSQNNTLGRGSGQGALIGIPVSRPPSSMSAYTMSPVSSTMGDDAASQMHMSQAHTPNSHMWPPSSAYRSSPDRSSGALDAQMLSIINAGMHTPTSTSSPPAHQYIHGYNHHHRQHSGSTAGGSGQGVHQLRLNTSSVQRSASGHSVSSGISELLEPSAVSQVRKDVLWQILVVSKSKADSEIDKMMRQWKETDSGAIVCSQDADAKPGVGDEDAIILKVKRGHRRSNSDMKRVDGDRNEFRRRVVELAHLIRNTSVSELSNDVVTRSITEQLYGLLTEHRARFVSDTNIGTLIVDILYQFSAVSQTVSQLAMSSMVFSGARGGMSGEASPAISQFPSPQLAPELSLARGSLGMLPSLSSALSSQHEPISARAGTLSSLRNQDDFDSLPNIPADSASLPTSANRIDSLTVDLSEYRIAPVASETPCPPGSVGGRMRPHDSSSYASSPRLHPGTAHSSTASLLSLAAPVNSSSNSVSGSFGRSTGGSLQQQQQQQHPHQRSRVYFPAAGSSAQPKRSSIELFDSESETSARPSLDELQTRPSLNRHASKLSISSDATDSHSSLQKRSVRASIQPHHFFNHFARLQQQQQQQQVPGSAQAQAQTPTQQRLLAKQQALSRLESSSDDTILPIKSNRLSRPATMYASAFDVHGTQRRVSESTSRQEKLARLLNQDFDSGESMPVSPAETPSQLYFETEPTTAFRHSPTTALMTIPEARRGSALDLQNMDLRKGAGKLATSMVEVSDFKRSVDSQIRTAANADEQANLAPKSESKAVSDSQSPTRPGKPTTSPRGSFISQMPQETESPTADQPRPLAEIQDQLPSGKASETSPKPGVKIEIETEAAAEAIPKAKGDAEGSVKADSDAEAATAEESEADDEMVVCRICERKFYRPDLNLHSDVCMLEQTRAMKLEDVNHRIKRLRDSVAKRLNDLKKVRHWDKVAVRESERVIRIAERAIVWPDGDSQHELIVAKSKFAKYIEKLESITGASSVSVSPAATAHQHTVAAVQQSMSPIASAASLPRADVETIWLAKRLLLRIRDKCTIIEEFDKEFSRLERQEALTRQAESASAMAEASSSQPASSNGQFMELPTWSQLAQHTGQRSPAASERTSMDFAPQQPKAGSALADTSSTLALGIGKGAGAVARRSSRHTLPSRQSISKSAGPATDTADADSPSGISGSPTSGGSGGSGSRKLVSLFAALFRNGSTGFGRNKEPSGPSVLRRKNTSSIFSSNPLPSMNRSSSALRKMSQNSQAANASASAVASASASTSASASASASVPVSTAAAPGFAGSGTAALDMSAAAAPASGTSTLAASPANVPLSSPVTRQRNNSQLSNMRSTPESTTKVQRMPSIEEFDFIKPISRGAFGRVYLTRKKATKDLYAIKVMRKKDMINKNMVTQALAERRALSLLSTEWVVQLYYAFHSSKHLFLVMEYLVGGDLAGLLRVWGVMEEDAAKFYIAEIACAIDYLHRNSIVHRDIKPDNVILASDGHIKLTDFGLSQVAVRGSASQNKALLEGVDNSASLESPTSDTTPLGDIDAAGRVPDKSEEYWSAALAQAGQRVHTPAAVVSSNAPSGKALPLSKRAHARKSSQRFLGTPDYLAPELLLGAGNGLAVDWWALGICLFEFVCGYPPFTDESPEAIFRNILNHAIDWPDEEGYVGEEAVELINALLRPDPTTRAHWKDIKAARLFEGWDMSVIRQMEPPFMPQPDDEVDTSYFEPCQRTEVQRLSDATFLHVDVPKRPPHASRQHSSRVIETVPSPDSSAPQQQGSRRGSRRGRSVPGSGSGSISTDPTHANALANANANANANVQVPASKVGQLKMLFSEIGINGGNGSPTKPSNDDKDSFVDNGLSDSEDKVAETKQKAESVSSLSSSDNYSFTNDTSKKTVSKSGNKTAHIGSSPKKIPFAALPAAAAGEESDSDAFCHPMRRNSSFNSLSDPEIDGTPVLTRPLSSLVMPLRQHSDDSDSMLHISSKLPPSALPPPLPLTHARRAIGGLPSQNYDSLAESGSSSPSTKSHSRCASSSIVLSGTKKSHSNARSRRPSDGPDNTIESELATPLIRCSSTDERLQNSNAGGSGTAMVSNAGGSGSEAENGSVAGDDSDDDDARKDEDSERVFEEFSYKNLALLSHVNKGVSSSSSHPIPLTERASIDVGVTAGTLTAPISTSLSTSAQLGSGLSIVPVKTRESLVNAYETNPKSSSDAF